MITTAPNIWNDLEIPDCLELVARRSPKNLALRLVNETDRQKWELHLWANVTPKRMSGFLYLEPREYGSTLKPDVAPIWQLIETLPKQPGRVYSTDLSVSFTGVAHETGLKLVALMLKAVADAMGAGR